MEFTNPFAPPRREMLPFDTRIMATDTTIKAVAGLSRRPSLRENFSYPGLSRHESSESRLSDISVPGMTDTSDSDISFDDDGVYNTSASELWDSFWPDSTTSKSGQSEDHHMALLRPRQYDDDFEIDPITRQQPADAYCCNALKITTEDHNLNVEEPNTSSHTFQSPPTQYTPKKSPVTYSVYPKVPVTKVLRYPHPPRTSSLSFEPPSSPPRPLFLRASRSSAALKPSKLGHDISPLFIAPSIPSATSHQRSSTTLKTVVSAPVSPVYPPPPPLKTLRPSTSAFSLRDKFWMHQNKNDNDDKKVLISHNMMAPLVPLLPSPLPEPLPMRPQPERFVSVFELDSDSETEADVDEGNSFAKRIVRGLHKKSGSEKRVVAERKTRFASLDAGTSSKDLREGKKNDGSLSRKRGGSLGRIFGLLGR